MKLIFVIQELPKTLNQPKLISRKILMAENLLRNTVLFLAEKRPLSTPNSSEAVAPPLSIKFKKIVGKSFQYYSDFKSKLFARKICTTIVPLFQQKNVL